MQTIETWLPVFPGFYDTIFEANVEDELWYQNDCRDTDLPIIEYDDLEFDNAQYEEDVVKQCTEFIESNLKALGLVSAIRFQGISSPKEYNFHNDSGNIEIDLSDENIVAIQGYVSFHETKYREWLADTYTSYDGFSSWYSNELSDWYEYTNDFSDFSKKKHYLGSVLEFICWNENITAEDMREGLYDIYESSYCKDRKDQVKCEECDEWFVYEGQEQLKEYRDTLSRQTKIWKETQGDKPLKTKTFKQVYPDFQFLCNKCNPKQDEGICED